MLRSTAKKLLALRKNNEVEERDGVASNGKVCLPEDLVIDILIRLPVKYVLRCKCVCKHWYTLIKSPTFISRHYNCDDNQTDLVFHHCVPVHRSKIPNNVFSVYRRRSLVRHQNFAYPIMAANMKVVGPVNGLFLLIGENYRLDLWNPATRESRTISKPNPKFPKHFTPFSMALGFGLDPLTHEYTIILVRYFYDWTLHTQVEAQIDPALYVVSIGVYNFATDSWNHLDPKMAELPPNVLFPRPSVYLNGHHYWISFSQYRPRITTFDTRNQVFRELLVPNGATYHYLSVYDDSIALLSHVLDTNTIDIWAMEVEGCWSKKHSIENLGEIERPLKLWKNNELYYDDRSSGLVLYNISTRETRSIRIRGFEYGIDILEYKESLVSVGSQSMKSESRNLLGMLKDFFIKKSF